MRRALRATVFAVGLGLALTPATQAGTPAGPSYDGTGSFGFPTDSLPYDPVVAAKAQAQEDIDRQAMARRAAYGRSSSDVANYAALLEQGDDTHAPDRAAALDAYEKAAAIGNTTGRRRMTIAYILGEGRPVDLQKGLDYATKLGVQDPAALFSAGVDFERGLTGPKDMAMAVTTYIDAAEAGSAEAMDAIGRLALAEGKLDVARGWFRQGVYYGSADAMDHLAAMAEAGQGGAVDKAEAYWLYTNAARRGSVHAQAWIDALPASTAPLPRIALKAKTGEMTLTRTYTLAGHAKTESLNPTALAADLGNYYPSAAINDRVEGSATVHCYVNGDHKIDACLIARELPAGYDFGKLLQQLYDGQITVSDTDAVGRPTAHSVFLLTLAWNLV